MSRSSKSVLSDLQADGTASETSQAHHRHHVLRKLLRSVRPRRPQGGDPRERRRGPVARDRYVTGGYAASRVRQCAPSAPGPQRLVGADLRWAARVDAHVVVLQRVHPPQGRPLPHQSDAARGREQLRGGTVAGDASAPLALKRLTAPRSTPVDGPTSPVSEDVQGLCVSTNDADRLVARKHRAAPREVQCGPRRTLRSLLLTGGLGDADECQMPAEEHARELRCAAFEERVQQIERLLQAGSVALVDEQFSKRDLDGVRCSVEGWMLRHQPPKALLGSRRVVVGVQVTEMLQGRCPLGGGTIFGALQDPFPQLSGSSVFSPPSARARPLMRKY